METKTILPGGPARHLIQGVFLASVLSVGIGRHLHLRVPTIDALCPFGAIEGLHYLVTSGRYLGKTFPSNMVLGVALFASVILAGGAFCGWVCPFGTLQEAMASLGRRIRLPTIRLPEVAERTLPHLRFVVLGGILWLTIAETELVFATICPYRTIFGLDWLFAPETLAGLALAVSGGILVGSLFITRFWCRFLCPLGGVISILSRISLVRVVRRPKQCTDCGLCRRACPMNLLRSEGTQAKSACTFCLKCTQACPRPGALIPAVRWPRLTFARLSYVAPLAAVGIFVGVILLGHYTGSWETTGKSEAYFSAVAREQRLEPEDIRGWMSLEQVSQATGVPLSYLYEAGGLGAELPTSTPLNELERLTSFETDDVRNVVAEYYQEHPDTQPVPGEAPPASRGRRSGGEGSGGQSDGRSGDGQGIYGQGDGQGDGQGHDGGRE